MQLFFDDARAEELEQLKQANELKRMKQEFEEGKVPSTAAEELQHAKAAIAEERQKLTEIGKVGLFLYNTVRNNKLLYLFHIYKVYSRRTECFRVSHSR
ncbi:unnamed protein product [Angiostrongylus costaricensis]|uniref:DUF3523 domain-containing protein n=1 Tax=Angiostrongylus costaricensis TaxID=334426 RepID=A0A0R3PIK8_ANGCS|nr:unnamed protein product [Angiostrongylus costaricensis]